MSVLRTKRLKITMYNFIHSYTCCFLLKVTYSDEYQSISDMKISMTKLLSVPSNLNDNIALKIRQQFLVNDFHNAT
jgi:hypothetical protein